MAFLSCIFCMPSRGCATGPLKEITGITRGKTIGFLLSSHRYTVDALPLHRGLPPLHLELPPLHRGGVKIPLYWRQILPLLHRANFGKLYRR